MVNFEQLFIIASYLFIFIYPINPFLLLQPISLFLHKESNSAWPTEISPRQQNDWVDCCCRCWKNYLLLHWIKSGIFIWTIISSSGLRVKILREFEKIYTDIIRKFGGPSASRKLSWQIFGNEGLIGPARHPWLYYLAFRSGQDGQIKPV